LGGTLQFASGGRSKPDASQSQGWRCGPVKTGPSIGWLSIGIDAPLESGRVTVSVVTPTGRPETTPR
jgi:hypothetical protein